MLIFSVENEFVQNGFAEMDSLQCRQQITVKVMTTEVISKRTWCSVDVTITL